VDGDVHALFGNRRDPGEFRLHAEPRQLTGYLLMKREVEREQVQGLTFTVTF
jgi:hypothetical protein